MKWLLLNRRGFDTLSKKYEVCGYIVLLKPTFKKATSTNKTKPIMWLSLKVSSLKSTNVNAVNTTSVIAYCVKIERFYSVFVRLVNSV